MNDRELATALAALRFLQTQQAIPAEVMDIATSCGIYEPLSNVEIDDLCLKLNWEEEIDPRIAKYLESPSQCLFCGSEDIEGGYIEIEGSIAWQTIRCNECGRHWDDLYVLNSVDADWDQKSHE